MKAYTLEIFSLAEKESLYNVIYNAIGWSPCPAHYNFVWRFKWPSKEEKDKDLFGRIKEAGLRLRIRRIFAIFDTPYTTGRTVLDAPEKGELTVNKTPYLDDALENLRTILKLIPNNVVFIESEGLRKDLEILTTYSPPLLERIKGKIQNDA